MTSLNEQSGAALRIDASLGYIASLQNTPIDARCMISIPENAQPKFLPQVLDLLRISDFRGTS